MATMSGAGTLGPELEIIQTEGLGFNALAGDAKVRLTSPWDPEPSPTASLLSIASRKGLVAAAGPDGIVVASTESVRKAFETAKTDDSDVRAFEPQAKIALPMRVSQLAFTADETLLIVSAETGGGLAVYDVQALLQGSTQTLFELATNGETLRALVPNPTVDKAELCALVGNNGSLYMANLKERALSNPLKIQVSSLSWSTKGKQLVAGLADGTIHQMTPEGEEKAVIPKPPEVGDYHVSALTWLENHLFLAIHTSTNESPPSSVYHIITRQPPSTFTFQKMMDPVDPFGAEKAPHHFILRLKDFPPNLQDLLLLASTASPDVGLLSRSKTPLASDKPAESITNVFTTTEMADDSRRATLPMTEDFQNAVPVGCALDLSAKETVYKPIPSEEINESPSPVPGFWVLTHEGILCSWWVIYSESIKSGTTYPGMASVDTSAQATAQTTTPAPAFATPGPSGGSAFGSATTTTPAFGGTSSLGAKASPWGAPTTAASGAATGGPTFGSSTFASSPATSTPTFGRPSGLTSSVGVKSSPWAAAASSGPAFGQSGFAGLGAGAAGGKSVFGSSTGSPAAAPSSGGFSGFASSGGFASLATGTSGGGSIFGKPVENSPFQSTDTKTAFPPAPKTPGTSGLFGSSTPFKLESSFKPDPNAKDEDDDKPAGGPSGLFGSGFTSALGQATSNASPSPAPSAQDQNMDAPETATSTPKPKSSIFSIPSTTPTTTPAPTRFSYETTTPKASIFGAPSESKPSTSIFGAPSGSKPSTSTFGAPSESKPSTSIFGAPSGSKPSTSIFGAPSGPKPSTSIFGNVPKTPEPLKSIESPVAETPQITLGDKHEGFDSTPLPPESTSRITYPDSASSGTPLDRSRSPSRPVDEAPLPPDFLATPKAKAAEDAPLPPDFLAVPATVKKTPAIPEAAPLPSASTTPLKSPSEKPKPSLFDSPNDAPLPPDFITKTQPKRVSPVPAVPESDEEGGFSEEDSDGSAVDVAKELSPSITGLAPTPQSSFGGMGGSSFLVRPEQEGRKPLFGEISRKAPIFPPPAATKQSPRSPSPVRPSRPFGLESVRSVSAPGMASQILGTAKKAQQPSSLGMSILGRSAAEEDSVQLQQRKARERREAEETRPLVDEEDDELRRFLESEPEPTLTLNEFVAHADVAPPAQDSVPAQVEAVYRDINSMIDTLGLNAHSLKAFILGHSSKPEETPHPKEKEDLVDPDGWVLCELEDLSDIVDEDLTAELDQGRVRSVEQKKDECHELLRNMSRLRSKQNELGVLLARFDDEQAEAHKNAPLSADQAAQQSDLRREFARLSKLLAEAEEAVTLLKTRMASAAGSSGKGPQPPTVDAVLRTISKMTTMVEKRSGDVDVLENQMRRMRLGSAAPSSREGTPMTPKRGSVVFSESGLGGSVSGTPRNLRNSFMSSVMSSRSPATPTRRKISGFTAEEKKELMEKRARKQAVLRKLRDGVEAKGVSVWAMEEME